MPKKNPLYYYRLYDDHEDFKYIKSALPQKQIRTLLKKFEKNRETYYSEEFISFLRKKDQKAEIISVDTISY